MTKEQVKGLNLKKGDYLSININGNMYGLTDCEHLFISKVGYFDEDSGILYEEYSGCIYSTDEDTQDMISYGEEVDLYNEFVNVEMADEEGVELLEKMIEDDRIEDIMLECSTEFNLN